MGDVSAQQGPAAAPLVSIIMPCYRVAEDLPRAIDDVRAQTYGSWELICVDDGSPDEVARVVRDNAARDARIRLVRHERNRGLSAARNTGLAAASGELMWMPDPDDRFEPDLLERAVDALTDPSCDLAIFGCREEQLESDGTVRPVRSLVPARTGSLTSEELRREALALEEATLLGYAWNKVYRRRVLEGLAFEDVPLIEDVLFNLQVVDRARGGALIARPLYRYQKRAGSNLTGRFVPKYFAVHRRRIAALLDCLQRWGEDTPDARARLGGRFARYVLSALERNCDVRAGMSGADRRRWCGELKADPLFRSLVLGARPHGSGALGRAGVALLRTRSTAAYLMAGRILHLLRRWGSRGYELAKRGSEGS
ncbi:MAG: glycosyltransferase family 2 protein [Coriobacteriaceae bacterium]|nr:glycosyltransferase family 2 protein [Coriobacteriaceae bacterium]